MKTNFITFIGHQNLCRATDNILLAVSGGIDSVVMAGLFHQCGYKFGIAHCNFRLRGAESNADEEFVETLATKYNVPFHVNRFDTNIYASQKGISVQMAARDLRYEWFEVIRNQFHFDAIATAHHLDDQIETFFINLVRGTGISGLHGILPRQGHVIRPLLFAYRDEIELFARENEIRFRNDASNDSTKYLRNKIRHELLPILKEMNPGFSESLTQTIRHLNETDVIVTKFVRQWKEEVSMQKGEEICIDLQRLTASEPIGTLAWELFAPYGFNQSQVNNIISGLGKERTNIFISSTHRAVKNRSQIIILPRSTPVPGRQTEIRDFVKRKQLSKPLRLRFLKIEAPDRYEIPASPDIASLNFDKLTFPLLIRKFIPGDSFYPLGMNKKKKVSDFFIDQKLSLPEKENTWLLCSGSKIVWIIGRRIDHRFRVTSQTRRILRIDLG